MITPKMLVHSTSMALRPFYLSRSFSHPSFKSKILPPFITTHKQAFIACSFLQPRGYGALAREDNSQMVKWTAIYKNISAINKDQTDETATSVLAQFETQGKIIEKSELYRVIKELRRFGRFKYALEVFEWMNERADKYLLSTSDMAIEIDLISKVRGIQSAEDYFRNLPNSLIDKRVQGSLLNAYARAEMREKAETLMAEMKNRNQATESLPYNVMMTLYMNLKDYDKVESTISEMEEKRIPFDVYTYNIWLSTRGSSGSIGKMEEVFENMKLDPKVKPSWTTYSSMASIYAKIGQVEKAEDCLRRLESQIKGRDRNPYHCLISLYGIVGNKTEIRRIWSTYKSIFSYIPNMGYHFMMAALVRVDDIEEAERLYDEWVSVKTSYDSRIANLLMGWYAKNGFYSKASKFYEGIYEHGGKPDSNTWEIVAGGLIGERRLAGALTCLNEALSSGGSKFWKPEPEKVNSLLEMCDEENDGDSKEVLLGILRRAGCFEDDTYMSSIAISSLDAEKENCS